MDESMKSHFLPDCIHESEASSDGSETTSPRLPQDPSEVVREFLPLIRRIARGLAFRNPSSLDAEDLTSVGIIGLLGALARFDSERAIKFRTFAEYRIRGMMLDEMRAMDWIPRSVRARKDQIYQASAAFVRREGRPPARHEIAELLGLTQEELDASSAYDTRMLSLDDPMGTHDEGYTLKDVLPDEEQLDPYALCVSSETNQALEMAITHLSGRQQDVMHQYYFQGLTMKEIGQTLSLTESGVCRIHAEILRKLQVALLEIDVAQPSKIKPQNVKGKRLSAKRHSVDSPNPLS